MNRFPPQLDQKEHQQPYQRQQSQEFPNATALSYAGGGGGYSHINDSSTYPQPSGSYYPLAAGDIRQSYVVTNPPKMGSKKFSVSSEPGSSASSTTLFVGDLSVVCDEERVFDLFRQYGEIESVQLKKSERDPQRSHLSYGFIRFKFPEAASTALKELNGKFFLGRHLRVGWADDHPGQGIGGKVKRSFDQKKNNLTAQVHVLFVCKDLNVVVSELHLGAVFGRFGNLVDIAIKKNVLNQEQRVRSGYGFVHFSLTKQGIESAIAAVDEVNHQTIDNITYECKVTHSLQAHIFALRRSDYPASVTPPPAIINHGFHRTLSNPQLSFPRSIPPNRGMSFMGSASPSLALSTYGAPASFHPVSKPTFVGSTSPRYSHMEYEYFDQSQTTGHGNLISDPQFSTYSSSSSVFNPRPPFEAPLGPPTMPEIMSRSESSFSDSMAALSIKYSDHSIVAPNYYDASELESRQEI